MNLRYLRFAAFALLAFATVSELVSAYRHSKDELVTLTYQGRQRLSGQLR